MPSTTSVDQQNTQGWRNQQPMILDGRYGHGYARIDEHRIIIVGGVDEYRRLSSGFIYDVRTQQSTPLRHDMPAALTGCRVVANDGFVYVLGGWDISGVPVNMVYRLCLETQEWSIMAPMDNARVDFAVALKDNYIYVFGGYSNNKSTERYSIDNNTWEELPDMPNGPRSGHCAVPSEGSDIYIVGGYNTRSVEVFDTATLTWKNETHLHDMPEIRRWAAAVVLKKKYLVVIGGDDEDSNATASCLIFDSSSNNWSSTPASMDMIEARQYHTAAVLDGKIVVAGGWSRDGDVLASVESIGADTLMEYAPLHYPLPDWILDRVFDIGRFERELVPCAVFDKLKAKKRKLN